MNPHRVGIIYSPCPCCEAWTRADHVAWSDRWDKWYFDVPLFACIWCGAQWAGELG